MNKTTLRTTADTWVRVWALPFLAALVIIAGSGVGFAIPSLGGPTGIVALPTADIATENKVDLVLGRQSFNIGDGDNTAWDLKALIGVGGRAELWAAHSRISSDFDSRLTSIGGKLQLMREPQDQASVAVGLGYFSWQDGLLSWVTSLPRATQAKWADSTPLGIRDDVKRLLGLAPSEPEHTLTVTATANPNMIGPTGGDVHVVATFTDSRGHGFGSIQWSDGGAGGTFANANVLDTTYTVSALPEGQTQRVITLTARVTCNGSPSIAANGTCTVTQNSVHDLTVTASCNPTTVSASGGTVQATATAQDTFGHGIATWAWDDGGAGGTFSPSAGISNPTYTATALPVGVTSRVITLTATATCDGSPALTASGHCTIEQGAHTIAVTATATPSQVPVTGGAVQLGATATDSLGHGIATWSWSDGGAGGTFNDAHAQTPIYTVPAHAARDITLTVTATCDGSPATTGNGTCTVTQAGGHSLTVTATADPNSMGPAGGNVHVVASFTDSLDHGLGSVLWNDGGAGGTFTDANALDTTYTVSALPVGQTHRTITLTARVTCNGSPSLTADGTCTVTQNSVHNLTVTASCNPTTVPALGGTVQATATAQDTFGHGIATWAWDDSGAGGTFSPSAAVSNPTYTATALPVGVTSRVITLTATATCDGSPPLTASGYCTIDQGAHAVTVTAAATPSQVPVTGGAVQLSGSASDTLGHGIAVWHWSDGGAGGSFNNANAQNPVYTVPPHAARDITLTVTATCDGSLPATGTGTCTVTQSGTHTVTVTADCNPKQVLSAGGPVTCTGSATDSFGHAIASYQWSDGGAGGTFNQPNPALAAATYQVSAYGLYDPRTITLTLTATCAGDGTTPVSGSNTVQITQFGPTLHEVIVTSCTAVPDQVDWQGNPDVTASATAFDSLGHGIATYKWTATPGTGHFVPPGGNGQTVTFVVNALTQYDPARTITLTVTATCNDVSPVSGQGQALISQSAFIPSGTAQVVPIGTRSRAVLGLLPHDSAPRAFGRLAGSLRSPLKPLAQSGLVVTPATVPTLDLLRTEDVKAWNAYIVATKDFTPTTGEAWEERSAANRLLGTAGLYYLKVDPGLGMGFSLTRPFLGFEFISTAGTVVGLEYRFRDNDLDERAVFSAVLRHYFSPEFAGELGTTNASPIGTGLSGQDLFVRVNYSIPIKAVY
jgi:hypothetical protein